MSISFDTYVKSSRSRSSISNLTKLQRLGFGVFGYYQDGKKYDGTGKPVFMWNQGVAYNNSTQYWEYDPLKYWPDADADGTGGLTFFAYAPYTDVVKSTTEGLQETGNSEGITAMTNVATAGDPQIQYRISPYPASATDLLYAEPLMDQTKETNDGVVKFHFRHALSRLTFSVASDASLPSTDGAVDPRQGTIILIKSLQLKGNIARLGQLDLHSYSSSAAPFWDYRGYDYDPDPVEDDSIQQYCPYGHTTLDLDTTSLYTGLRDVDWAKTDTATWNSRCRVGGVTATAKPLLQTTDERAWGGSANTIGYLLLVPTDTALKKCALQLLVTYTIQTIDSSLVLTGGYHREEVTLEAPLIMDALEPGMSYHIELDISFRSLSFKVTSDTWRDPVEIWYDPSVEEWRDKDGGSLDFTTVEQ